MFEGYRTYIGIFISFIGAVLQMFKINITTQDIQPIVDTALQLGGLVIATYGRWKAKPKVV